MAGTLTNYTTVTTCCSVSGKAGRTWWWISGPVSTLTGASVNQRIPITQFNATQLAELGSRNSLAWSAFTWLANDTLFVTSPRSSVDQQAAPWLASPLGNQQLVDGRMAKVPQGAASFNAANPNANNSSTVVIEASDTPSLQDPGYAAGGTSYSSALAGSFGGNFNGFFQGNPEKITPGTFTTAGKVVRSDFYSMTPNAGYPQGTWLGYFEFAHSGTMTYVAYPINTQVVQSISRSNNTTTITYTAGQYGTYTLRGVNNAVTAGARTNWPVVAPLTSGDNSIHTITDTTADDIKFYTITAQ